MSASQATVRRSLPWLLAALSMIGPFSIDAVFPSFPLIGARFAVDDTALQQLISVYLVTYAGMSLFHGALSDALGRKPVIVTGLLVYALASVGAAMSTSFAVLLCCRALQGACAGAGVVVGRAVIRDSLGGAAAQRLMSRVLMIFGVAPVIAPMVGAGLLSFGGWPGIFWLLTGYSGLLALALLAWLEESHPVSARRAFAPGLLLASYVAFCRDRAFWPLIISGSVNFAGLFLYIASAPRIVRGLLHLSADGFPRLFLPVVIGLIGGAWAAGRLAGRGSINVCVALGYALMLLACALHLVLALVLSQAALPWSMLPLIVQGIGVQLAFPTLTLLLLDRFPHQRGGISSVQAFASLLLSSLVAGVLSPMLSSRMLDLAIGASVLTVIGALAWWWYRAGDRHAVEVDLPEAEATVAMQAQLVEPH